MLRSLITWTSNRSAQKQKSHTGVIPSKKSSYSMIDCGFNIEKVKRFLNFSFGFLSDIQQHFISELKYRDIFRINLRRVSLSHKLRDWDIVTPVQDSLIQGRELKIFRYIVYGVRAYNPPEYNDLDSGKRQELREAQSMKGIYTGGA